MRVAETSGFGWPFCDNVHQMPTITSATSATDVMKVRGDRSTLCIAIDCAGAAMLTRSTNSAMVAYRSAGTGARAASTASSTCGGTAERTGRSGRAVSKDLRASNACGLAPLNGGSPANIS